MGDQVTGVWLDEAAVDAIRAALDGAPVRCPFHGNEFGRSTGWERGQPRCESCRQPWRVGRARTFLADACRSDQAPMSARGVSAILADLASPESRLVADGGGLS